MMITISAFKDREEALISKALLEAAGIPVTLRDEYGELQLQVRDTDAHLAHEVLVCDEPDPERVSRLNLGRLKSGGSARVGMQFIKGGTLVVVSFLLLLLLLMPLGVGLRITPFGLFFLFVFGGCTSIILGSFKIKAKRPFRNRMPM